MVNKIKRFFGETGAELKKVSWSDRDEIIHSTIVIIIMTAILTIFIAIWDFVFSHLINIIIR